MAAPKYTPTRNKALGDALIELRKGSRTQPHADRRTRRARTRRGGLERAKKDFE